MINAFAPTFTAQLQFCTYPGLIPVAVTAYSVGQIGMPAF